MFNQNVNKSGTSGGGRPKKVHKSLHSKNIVNIGPFEQSMKANICSYFSKLENVEKCMTLIYKGDLHASVMFKSERDAKSFLSMPWEEIKDYILNAIPDDPAHPLLSPPDQDSHLHILIALNDDCLHEIFRRLTLFDLINASQTCTRFNRQAKLTFRSKFTHFKLPYNFRTQPEKVSLVLTTFGSCIESLEICHDRLDSSFLQTIIQECNQLKSLSLYAVHFRNDNSVWTKCRTLFAQLENLTLNQSNFLNRPDDLLAFCFNLRKLLFFGGHTPRTCVAINQHFPQLEEAHLFYCIENDILVDFIALNPQLAKLSICLSSRPRTDSQIFPLIGQTMSNLRYLNFAESIIQNGNFQNDVISIANLHSLTVLKLSFNEWSIAPLTRALVANKVPIEHFKIKRGQIDDDGIECVQQLERLEVLEVIDCTNRCYNRLIALVHGMPRLRDLHVHGGTPDISAVDLKRAIRYSNKLLLLQLHRINMFTMNHIEINIDDYNEMLKIVQKRPEETRPLIVRMQRDEHIEITVPEDILKENRDIFYIELV